MAWSGIVFGFDFLRAYTDSSGGLVAQGDFHAVNAENGGVAGWGAAQNGDQRTGNKPHVHKMVLDRFRQVQRHQNGRFPDLQFAQQAHLTNSLESAEREARSGGGLNSKYDRIGRNSVYDHSSPGCKRRLQESLIRAE
jgi:hypothetical protein